MTLSNLSSRGTIRGTVYRGGGGGITDYNFLSGKPQINGVTVEDNHDGGYYGLLDSVDVDVTEIYEIGYGSNYDINLNGASVHVTDKIFKGATNSSNGAKGLVPAPAAGSVGKILSNEGWINPPTALPDYSTSEQKTGQKWIDGKDIYFKTIQLGTTIESTQWFNIEPHNNIYDRVINAFANGQYFSAPIYIAHNDATYLEGRTPYAAPIDTIVIYYTKN